MMADGNRFDDMKVDVREVYRRFPYDEKASAPAGKDAFRSLYSCPLLPLSWRSSARRALRRTHLDLGWFEEFRDYWSSVLSGRPLWSVHDFYYLANVYRVRTQAKAAGGLLPGTQDPQAHLAAWQAPELISLLFHHVHKESERDELNVLRRLRAHSRSAPAAILEYGCGIAPVARTLLDLEDPAGTKVYIADLQTLAFHYACRRFRGDRRVSPVLLRPEDGFAPKLPAQVDAVVCLTVFEHLNKPLETARALHRVLAKGGLLVFDYILSEGTGLDTEWGARERDAVLDFIGGSFSLVEGRLDKGASMGLTVARKV